MQLQAVAASQKLLSIALSQDNKKTDHWLAVPLTSDRQRVTWASMLPSHLTPRCGPQHLSAASCCMDLTSRQSSVTPSNMPLWATYPQELHSSLMPQQLGQLQLCIMEQASKWAFSMMPIS